LVNCNLPRTPALCALTSVRADAFSVAEGTYRGSWNFRHWTSKVKSPKRHFWGLDHTKHALRYLAARHHTIGHFTAAKFIITRGRSIYARGQSAVYGWLRADLASIWATSYLLATAQQKNPPIPCGESGRFFRGVAGLSMKHAHNRPNSTENRTLHSIVPPITFCTRQD
jgi:hypothetical protein